MLTKWVKILVKSKSQNLYVRYSQKAFDHAKKLATDALKFPSKRVIQTTAEETGCLICNKIANKIIETSITFQSKTEDVEFEKAIKIPKEM